MPTVRRVLAPNPGPFTGPGTNTWLLGDGPARVLIDPGPDLDAHRQAVGRALEGAALGVILVTHDHLDHLAGAEALALGHHCRIARYPELADGDEILVSGLSLQAIHTPGHAPDHLSFWMAEDRVLFCGDLILGQGSSVIAWPGGDVGDYLDSIARVAQLAPRMLFPGHFDPVLAAGPRIEECRRHRLEREAQIAAALSPTAQDANQISRAVYGAELRSRPGAEQLHLAALASTRAHLEKLERDGRAQRILSAGPEPRWLLPEVG